MLLNYSKCSLHRSEKLLFSYGSRGDDYLRVFCWSGYITFASSYKQ